MHADDKRKCSRRTKVRERVIFVFVKFFSNLFSFNEKLNKISRQREAVQDLAPYLWHSFGSIAALLQEVISVYPAINPPTLTVIRYFN